MVLPPRARLAAVLWIVLVVVVWNVVFDRAIVVAALEYASAARHAALQSGTALLIDDWMPPAIARGFWSATAVGGAIGFAGLAAFTWALRPWAGRRR